MKKSNRFGELKSFLKSDVEMLYGNYPMILLLRHAERFKILHGSTGNNVKLTKNGQMESNNLGEKLFLKKIGEIFSSPLLRCRHTAKHILMGASQTNLIIKSNKILGNPGCFVEDSNVCGEYFSKNGTIETVLDYISGNQLPGFRNQKEGANIMESFLIKNLSSIETKINLAISHDAIIMSFIVNYFDYNFSQENWLNFLEGIILFKKKDGYFLMFKGKIQKLH